MSVPVIFIMGTTATGKTDAAAALYDAVDTEIISVDSSLVYQGMDIGTAKPNADFLARYPHHLVDVCHPNHAYSVADFYADSVALIERAIKQRKVPILVGGTHFYFSALEHGLTDLPKANAQLREQISQRAKETGWPQLHEQLQALDPLSAQRIDRNDAQRIQRALEIVLSSGKPVAAHNAQRKPPIQHPIVKIALGFSDRKVLHRRIEQRFDAMLAQGLEAEVKALLAAGVNADAASMRMIGYRQMLKYLQGEIDMPRMRESGIVATRQLAKRQLTWLRNQANVVWWVDFGLIDRSYGELVKFVKQYVN